MKKKEIIEIIKNKKIIRNSKILPLYSYCSNNEDIKSILEKVIEENETLKNQYKTDTKAKEEFDSFKSSCKCTHEIRKKVYVEDDEDLFRENYYYECVFCGHKIPISFSNADWYERHFYNYSVYFENNEIGIFDIILKILEEKDDDDEINLVEEFKRLNLDQTVCTINDDERQNNYVMIIDNSIKSKEKPSIGEINLLDYISKLNGVRVHLISKSITYDRLRYGLLYDGKYKYPKDMLISSDIYFPIDVLEKDKKNNLPFKIIINLSPTLTYYNGTTNEKEPMYTALKDMFPNSIIITLPKLNEENIDDILYYIKDVFSNTKKPEFDSKKIKTLKKTM